MNHGETGGGGVGGYAPRPEILLKAKIRLSSLHVFRVVDFFLHRVLLRKSHLDDMAQLLSLTGGSTVFDKEADFSLGSFVSRNSWTSAR